MSGKKAAALYLFTVAAFLLLSWRVEHNSADRLAKNIYENCLIRNASIERVNNVWRGLADIEANNPFAAQSSTAKATVERRIRLYRQAIATRGVCVKP